jgi:hypothetical protein
MVASMISCRQREIFSTGIGMTASETTQNSSGPLNYDELVARIIRQHGSLPKSFQRVARYVIQNPNEIAFRSSKQIADRVDVQASTLVRFAQVFGYYGFSEMQLVFRARLASVLPAFSERVDAIAGLIGSTGAKAGTLRALATMAIAALQRAVETIISLVGAVPFRSRPICSMFCSRGRRIAA